MNTLNFKKWRWPAVISLVFLGLLGIVFGLNSVQPPVDSNTVDSHTAGADIQMQPIFASAKVEVAPQIEIFSQISGNVSEVMVAEGDTVSNGQTLFTLQTKTDYAALQKARAATAQADARFRKISEQTQAGSELSLKRAKAALDSAKKQYARTGELAAKGMVSQQHAADALHNLTIAQNQLTTTQFQAKALRAKGSEYALAELALNRAKENEKTIRDKALKQAIKAEADGILASCKVARGDLVSQGKPLALIAPADAVRVVAHLDVKYLQDLKPGQQALVTLQGQAERYPAYLSGIKPAAEHAQGNAEFKFDTGKQPPNLAADTVLSLEIIVSDRTDTLGAAPKIEDRTPVRSAQAG